MTNTERIDGLAELGCGMIQAQLTLASQSAQQALQDLWVLGYSWGFFDAASQRAKLDQYSEGLLLATVGFNALVAGSFDLMSGAENVRRALDLQTDAHFRDGCTVGGNDLFTWLADTTKAPMSLFNHLCLADA